MCFCASFQTHGHPCRAFDLFSLFLALFLSVCLSYPLLFSFHFHLNPVLNLFLTHWHSANWGVWPLGQKYPSHILDDFHHSETTEIIFQEQSSDAVPSCWIDAEVDDETIGRALSSPLSFRSEKNQWTEDKLITLLKKVCCQLSPFLCVIPERGDPCTNLVRQVRAAEKNQVATQKTSESGFSLKDKKSKFSLIMEQRFKNTSFKPILRGEVSRNSRIIEYQRR